MNQPTFHPGETSTVRSWFPEELGCGFKPRRHLRNYNRVVGAEGLEPPTYAL